MKQDSKHTTMTYKPEYVKLISNRLGINIRPDHLDLDNIIDDACNKFKCTALEYLQLLQECNDNSALLEHLVAGITIGETYFFRDKRQVELLKDNVLPQIIRAKRISNNLSIRIWSAGCSSGEEIYTIAMLLNEILKDKDKWSISLLATDININVLQKAKTGKYNKWSMRSIDDYYIKKYFKQDNNTYTILPSLNHSVNFQYLNLNDDTYPSMLNNTNSLDLIICRNVLIYFSQPVIQRIMKKLAACLSDDGCLLLGASDPVDIAHTDLIFHHNHGMLFSRNLALNPEKATPKKDSKLNSIIKPVTKKTSLQILPTNNKLKEASTISQSIILNNKAKEAANLGQLDVAIKYCKNSILLDATNKETYFIYALTLIELNNFAEAISALRKVIFLDRNFVEGHFQLGLLLLKMEQYALGMKSLNNALKIIESHDSSQLVPGSEGLTYGRFQQILEAEIELYTKPREQADDN